MKTVTITREKGFYGRMRELRLFADSHEVGSIKSGATQTFEIPVTATSLDGKMDWGRTYAIDLSGVQDGDSLTITSWFTLNPFRQVGLMKLPVRIEKTTHISTG